MVVKFSDSHIRINTKTYPRNIYRFEIIRTHEKMFRVKYFYKAKKYFLFGDLVEKSDFILDDCQSESIDMIFMKFDEAKEFVDTVVDEIENWEREEKSPDTVYSKEVNFANCQA